MRSCAFLAIVAIFLQNMGTLSSASAEPTRIVDLCTPNHTVQLEETGASSIAAVSLANNSAKLCLMKVTAPNSSLVNLQFIEATPELQHARIFNYTTKNPPCLMSIYLPQNQRKAVWIGDPCSIDFLPDIDLLTPEFRIVWTPPKNPANTKGRKFVLTAIGKGDICKNPDQHVCSRIGWEPNLCVSKTLQCDEIENCPKGSSTSDEDERLCTISAIPARNTWEQMVVEMVKKFKSASEMKNEMMNNKWLQEKLKERGYTGSLTTSKVPLMWKEWEELKLLEVSETTTQQTVKEKHSAAESIAEVLSHYGPWGYLMLGMLICGTVLMFCGLWECCFRRPKPADDETVHVPPSTVLIINPAEENRPQPPRYEELDQPPSYSYLFPNLKMTSGVVPVPSPNSEETTVEIEIVRELRDSSSNRSEDSSESLNVDAITINEAAGCCNTQERGD